MTKSLAQNMWDDLKLALYCPSPETFTLSTCLQYHQPLQGLWDIQAPLYLLVFLITNNHRAQLSNANHQQPGWPAFSVLIQRVMIWIRSPNTSSALCFSHPGNSGCLLMLVLSSCTAALFYTPPVLQSLIKHLSLTAQTLSLMLVQSANTSRTYEYGQPLFSISVVSTNLTAVSLGIDFSQHFLTKHQALHIINGFVADRKLYFLWTWHKLLH